MSSLLFVGGASFPPDRTGSAAATRAPQTAEFAPSEEWAASDQTYPLPGDSVASGQWIVQPGKAPVFTLDGTAAGEAVLLYSNTLSQAVQGPPSSLVTAMLADDLGLTVEPGCPLDHYVFRVTGNLTGSPTEWRPYRVTFALYDDCPRAGGALIPGTEGSLELPSPDMYTIVLQLAPDAVVPLPGTVWLGISFNRDNAGTPVGAPALVGFSQDSFDHPAASCGTSLGIGGFGYGLHASFYAQVYGRPGCTESSIAYRAMRASNALFTPRVGAWFADDLYPALSSCELVAYEAHVKGTGTVEMDLRTELVNGDVEAGVIPGSRTTAIVTSTTSRLIRTVLDPPVPIHDQLWVAFRTSTTTAGPVMAGRPAGFGSTGDLHQYQLFSSGQWVTYYPSASTSFALDVTLWCKGPAPIGACCDLILTDPDGEAVCRQVAKINCPVNRWLESKACEPDPFDPPCGVARCCTPQDTCEDLTYNQCADLVPGSPSVLWDRVHLCEDLGLSCPFYACTQHRGDCALARSDTGCMNPFCCQAVCEFDPWCCQVTWDVGCVRWTEGFAESCGGPSNNECASGSASQQALVIEPNSTTYLSTFAATTAASDPPLCCFAGDPSAKGSGTVWFRFTASHPTARISTCASEAPADDSLITVFRSGDAATPQSACASLVALACNDDLAGCGPSGRNAEVCMENLIPGETYYILLAAKTDADRGLYRLDVTSPATCVFPHPPIANDQCMYATPLSGATVVTPFDLSGGPDFADATFDCPAPDCQQYLRNDIWYDWIAPATGQASFTTCGGSDATTPDTGLVVYDGCDCPVSNAKVIGCNDFQLTPCFLGARISNLPVVGGHCYKIRLAGDSGSTPAGVLQIDSFPRAATLVSELPAREVSLPQIQRNAVRLVFNDPVGLPAGGEVLIQELLPGGAFGPDLSTSFTFTNPFNTVLQVMDGGATFQNGKWYAIRNTGGWTSVNGFEVAYIILHGDADGSLINTFADLSEIFRFVGSQTVPGDRHDINADGSINFADINAAFGFYGAFAPPKPKGHETSSGP